MEGYRKINWQYINKPPIYRLEILQSENSNITRLLLTETKRPQNVYFCISFEQLEMFQQFFIDRDKKKNQSHFC